MWRKISLVALIVVLALGIILGGSLAVMRMTPPDAKSIGIRNGDIILQTILGTQGMAIIAASSSPYTHMGFIKTGGKEPVVVEAVGPVKETPLTQWISRGVGQRITILRLKGITPEIARKAAATAKKHYGKPYDFYFLPDKKSFYCSELVREAYAGAGVTLGKLQKVGELTKSSAMDTIIEQRWKYYPPCQGITGITMEKCRRIIMEQELVTPASIARDPQLEPVFSNYPLDSR
ncbi:MAG: peptidoglycan peptidase [Alphaproteobacteria bacterium]|nr:peptidoglycan peptidase [Alphaproteobacteria bacterium]